jgi:hypothetical protein
MNNESGYTFGGEYREYVENTIVKKTPKPAA